MPNLSIKDVPEELAQHLRERAARNHRSLQGELMSILYQAIDEKTQTLYVAEPERTHTSNAAAEYATPRAVIGLGVRMGTKTIEEVAADIRARWPEPLDTGPMAVDIIRQERDVR